MSANVTSLAKITRLTCVQCGAHYREGEHPYTCPKCGIEGILDVEYDYDVARRSMDPRHAALWLGFIGLVQFAPV